MDQKINIEKAYDWMVLPDTYLLTGIILCNEILKNDSFDTLFKRNNFRSGHPNESLLSPIIFCLKHGVELYTKTIIGLNEGSFNRTHDIKILLNKLSDQILAEKAWSIVEKYYFGTYLPEIRSENNPDRSNESERYPETDCSYSVNLKFSGEIELENMLNNIKSDILEIEKLFSQAKRENNIRSILAN